MLNFDDFRRNIFWHHDHRIFWRFLKIFCYFFPYFFWFWGYFFHNFSTHFLKQPTFGGKMFHAKLRQKLFWEGGAKNLKKYLLNQKKSRKKYKNILKNNQKCSFVAIVPSVATKIPKIQQMRGRFDPICTLKSAFILFLDCTL